MNFLQHRLMNVESRDPTNDRKNTAMCVLAARTVTTRKWRPSCSCVIHHLNHFYCYDEGIESVLVPYHLSSPRRSMQRESSLSKYHFSRLHLELHTTCNVWVKCDRCASTWSRGQFHQGLPSTSVGPLDCVLVL